MMQMSGVVRMNLWEFHDLVSCKRKIDAEYYSNIDCFEERGVLLPTLFGEWHKNVRTSAQRRSVSFAHDDTKNTPFRATPQKAWGARRRVLATIQPAFDGKAA